MVSVEFNRFINYYKKLETFQINLQVLKDVDRDGAPRDNNGGATRYFVNMVLEITSIGCH
jgi:ATP-dependent RNA helicase DeaD